MLRAKKGYTAIFWTVLTVLVMTVLVIAISESFPSYYATPNLLQASFQDFYYCEPGIQHAKNLIGNGDVALALGGGSTTLQFTIPVALTNPAVTVTMTFTRNGSDASVDDYTIVVNHDNTRRNVTASYLDGDITAII